MDYSQLAKEIRIDILKMVHKAREAHIGSSLSCVEILLALYCKILSVDPKNPLSEERDRFVLSKGHAVAALYAVLAKKGFFSKESLNEYCQEGTKMSGHSTYQCMPGVEVSTGSLGHGLPMASGMALAGKKDNKDYRVFALLSDGECQEGSNWEAALFASHHKLDNLTAIIDYNKIQALGETNKVLKIEPLKNKWESFGWKVKEADGHNVKELTDSLSEIPFEKGKPSLVIAHTVKGKGISFLENKLISHYKHFSEEEYQKALEDLEK